MVTASSAMGGVASDRNARTATRLLPRRAAAHTCCARLPALARDTAGAARTHVALRVHAARPALGEPGITRRLALPSGAHEAVAASVAAVAAVGGVRAGVRAAHAARAEPRLALASAAATGLTGAAGYAAGAAARRVAVRRHAHATAKGLPRGAAPAGVRAVVAARAAARGRKQEEHAQSPTSKPGLPNHLDSRLATNDQR